MNGYDKAFVAVGIGFIVLLVLIGVGNLLNPEEIQSTNTECMDLMDMDFSSEQECLEFVRGYLVKLEII